MASIAVERAVHESRSRRDMVKYVFIWPAFLVVLAVGLFPLIYSFTMSFQSIRLVPPLPPRFVGVENYWTILQTERFWHVIGVTSLFAFASVAIEYVIGFAIALALHNKVRGEKLFRISFLLPMLLAPIAVALVGRMMFHSSVGPLNDLFTHLGLPNLPFLTSTNWALGAIITVEVWQWTPFVILMMLAGLQSLPIDVYESAALENASNWRQFWDLTFPMLLPVSAAVVFIRLIESLKIMDTVFVLTGGGPGDATRTVVQHLFEAAFQNFFQFGAASAMAWVLFAIILVFSVLQFRLLRGHTEY